MYIGLHFLGISLLLGSAHSVVVSTTYGQVRGQTLRLHNGKDVDTFLGIMFAAPTGGDNRFRAPVPPDPWTGIVDANQYPPACPQNGVGTYGEDCLGMNIYRPHGEGQGPFPVMVFLYGGAFLYGSNRGTAGHFLAAKDVVVVSPNYRLASFGFAHTGDDTADSNAAILDLIVVLQYIQDNIASFNGDPSSVTVFGNSAGGSMAAFLTVSPLAEGLFHRVIMQSGTDEVYWAINDPDSDPVSYIEQVATRVGCPTFPSDLMMDCLRSIPMDTLRVSDWLNCQSGHYCMGIQPVVDGDVIPLRPSDLRATGAFHRVPIMSGHTTEDGSSFVYEIWPNPGNGGPNRTEWQNSINNYVNTYRFNFVDEADYDPQRLSDISAALQWYYAPYPNEEDRDANRQGLVEMKTDIDYAYSSHVVLQAHAQFAETYSFLFGYKADNFNQSPWMGVPHGEEVVYLNGQPFYDLNPEVAAEIGHSNNKYVWTDNDREFSDFMITLWTNYAKFGNPTPSPITPPGMNTTVAWSPYTLTALNYIYLGHQTEMRQNYRQRNFALWGEFFEYLSAT